MATARTGTRPKVPTVLDLRGGKWISSAQYRLPIWKFLDVCLHQFPGRGKWTRGKILRAWKWWQGDTPWTLQRQNTCIWSADRITLQPSTVLVRRLVQQRRVPPARNPPPIFLSWLHFHKLYWSYFEFLHLLPTHMPPLPTQHPQSQYPPLRGIHPRPRTKQAGGNIES